MDTVELLITQDTPHAAVVKYTAQILDRLGSRLFVSVPPILSDDFVAVVQPQAPVELHLDESSDLAPIMGVVHAIEPDGLWLALPAAFDSLRQQRRAHIRVNATFPLQVTTKESEMPDEATSIRISGGGLRFRTSTQYKPEDVLKLTFELPQGARRVPVNVQGRVVYRKVVPHNNRLFDVAVEFVDVLPRVEDLIVGFCFQHQVHQTRHLQ